MSWNGGKRGLSGLFVTNKVALTFGQPLATFISSNFPFINFLLLSKVAGSTCKFEYFIAWVCIDSILPQVYFNLVGTVKSWLSFIEHIHKDCIVSILDPREASVVSVLDHLK